MRAYLLTLTLLAVLAVSLATKLEPWFQAWEGNRTRSANMLQVALGDSRRLFAKHFFVKTDAYFHNGYYPTIYDNKEGYAKAHISEDMHQEGGDEEAENFLGKPRDWIDRFGRNFFPARHTHLGDSGCGQSCCQRAKESKGHDENCEHKDHDHNATDESGIEREILPWLRFSVDLDPQRVETYVVASYWLCRSLKKVNEAEQFLREGLQNNPGDYELLFELGRLYQQERKDSRRARNVWELALKNWHQREDGKSGPNTFVRAQLLNHLALLEFGENNFAKAAEYYRELLPISPSQESISKWIKESDEKAAAQRSESGTPGR